VQNAPTGTTDRLPRPIATDGLPTHPTPQVPDTWLHCGYGGFVRNRANGDPYPGELRRMFSLASRAGKVPPPPVPGLSYVADLEIGPLTAVRNQGAAGPRYDLAVDGTVALATVLINGLQTFTFDGASSLEFVPVAPPGAGYRPYTMYAVIQTPAVAPTVAAGIVGGVGAGHINLTQEPGGLRLGNTMQTPAVPVDPSTAYIVVGQFTTQYGTLRVINSGVRSASALFGAGQPLTSLTMGVTSPAAGSLHWDGSVAEIQIYPGVVAPAADKQLLLALSLRYGIAIG
jgi:hypothetical protein